VTTSGQVHRISVSLTKGSKKTNVEKVELQQDHGIVGDAHAGSERQVSLLPFESFDKVSEQGLEVQPGEFAENITTVGLEYDSITVGDSLLVGDGIELEVIQIGKECHNGCYIREIVGDCIMPREGIFTRVARGGALQVGDGIVWKRKQV